MSQPQFTYMYMEVSFVYPLHEIRKCLHLIIQSRVLFRVNLDLPGLLDFQEKMDLRWDK